MNNNAITVRQMELRLAASIYSTGWQTALARPPRIVVRSAELAGPPPAVCSIPLRPLAVPTRGYAFAQPEAELAPSPPESSSLSPPRQATVDLKPPPPPGRVTRIQPPREIIKLEDRLFYLLQPPLESLLGHQSLALPHPPFPYQLQGIAFLYPRYAAILADEMGLGKTMQAIATIRLLLRLGELRSVLLICPKPLVSNWVREFALWAPEIPTLVIAGEQARREWQWQLPGVPVKVANYELLIRDRDLIGEGKQPFDLVVLDEAQRIKNRGSTTSQVARSVARRRSWALTGTPIENSPDDLVGIFEFLAPGCLSSQMTPSRMGRAARDYVLRRTKDKVLPDLPPKMYRDAELELLPQQRISYELAEQEGLVRLTEMGDAVTIQHVFELVLRLKQICNFDPATGESCKLEWLLADLEEVAASGRKAIVFSQWVQTLERLRRVLAPFGPLTYHGGIGAGRRDAVIRQFRDDPRAHVMLMSYGAGSVGLNLQFASYVFLFDRWWNPAVEDQAINRAHRIGAAEPVTVTRFLALDTIEQRIDQVLSDKRELFATMLAQTDTPRNLGLSQRELFGLFHLPPRAADEAA